MIGPNNKKRLSINLSIFTPTDHNNNINSPKSSSPNKFEDPNGVGILAAISNNNNINNKSTLLSISPKLISSSSNPIPILTNNSPKPKNQQQQPPNNVIIEGMEMYEEYTCVISKHKGSNLVRKREYFDDQFLGNGYHHKAAAAAASAPNDMFRTADFLNACSLCQKQLHGLDIFIYRGEKAFCSSDCRCKQISIDEHKEKCGSGTMKSPEYSASPCSGPMQFSSGVAVA